jgi:hypothetical protein
VNLICGFCRERGKACADTGSGGSERESVERLKPGGVEYRCGRAPADRFVVVMKLL